MSNYLVDSLLILVWSIWLLLACACVLRPEALRLSGFTVKRVRDVDQWQRLCMAFKHTAYVWVFIHFVRGCARWGFGRAQTDLIVVCFVYPVQLCLVWTFTFMVVVMARWRLSSWRLIVYIMTTIFIAFAGAWVLVGFAGRPQILVLFVGMYHCRQCFSLTRMLRRRQESSAAASDDVSVDGSDTPIVTRRKSDSVEFALKPCDDEGLRKTHAFERRLVRIVIQLLIFICCAFCVILMGCVWLSQVQQHKGLYLGDVVTWKRTSTGIEFSNAGVSRLTLSTVSNSSAAEDSDASIGAPPPLPSYAVCGHTYHGLSLVDYGLLALASYITPTVETDLPSLLSTVMKRTINIKSAPAETTSNRRWLELEVPTCSGGNSLLFSQVLAGDYTGRTDCRDLTVFAISGTDPTRMADYAENLRMWTEPVAMQILAFFFPTVRIWPRHTTAFVIARIHQALRRLGLEDDPWHYYEILERVQQLPEEREVVMTGHSLGGGMALVVGALTGRLAVALQPPGAYHSLAKHLDRRGGEAEGATVHRRSVSISLEGDWIQNFDSHGGLVQTLECDSKSLALGCHMVEGLVCHLLRHCGDREQRFTSCRHDFTPDATIWSVAADAFARMASRTLGDASATGNDKGEL
eukprot:TRINITY_DN66060_c0_g1_i1.p1 TRINITY_DN66060_c0_g1~~TRINITY_DN66060_c0_g1_i1.p1  ORF type:complete len:694 (-),score=53.18 TRINITY_DN66060_c0_g1_i1:15-1916(-)